MQRFWKKWTRRFAPLAGAAVLLQAGSCSVDSQQLIAGVANSVLSSVVTNFVYASFNLIP
jgi:hypothetical protein